MSFNGSIKSNGEGLNINKVQIQIIKNIANKALKNFKSLFELPIMSKIEFNFF
jgi:hypothetical protein